MDLELLTQGRWRSEKKRLIGFALRFGDKRLAVATMHALRTLDDRFLAADAHGVFGAVIVVATHGNRIVGFGFAADRGEGGSLVVVHPDARGLGIGAKIVEAMIGRLGSMTCNVAADNTASMAICFKLGMKAVSMHRGPTGKPTLRFEKTSSAEAPVSV
ncbi:GNAT family N-acetyltransferase [Paenibacillus harenae]|uniref:GNAT family N-acetyltransferase n=1 Tax=Paenibacillus harenae TaxID=306543 RepID=UPI0027937B2F|nr:GNAT family N-acetyltransferase [Paenibacillus harenae]MDQ0061178.1 GNAT superfamily N-acetyltransferase [Paenibacillus harenae]